ncbi:MAG: Cna B-type domain-containing protein, partial [Raoultibacter sp.]
LNADAKVTIDGKENTYAANKPFELNIPEGTNDKDIAIAADVPSLEVTLDTYPNKSGSAAAKVTPTTLQTINPGATATFVVQRPEAGKELRKNWNDNNASAQRPDPTTFKGMLSLEYRLQSDAADKPASWKKVSDNLVALGYEILPAIPDAIPETINTSVWVYSFDNLSALDPSGNKIAYRLAETLAGDTATKYTGSYIGPNKDMLLNTLKVPYTATKKWMDGNNMPAAHQPRIDSAAWVDAVKSIQRTSDSTVPTMIPLTVSDTAAEGYVTIVDNKDNTWSITMPNTLGYDEKGLPYIYSLTETPIAAKTSEDSASPHAGSHYAATYLNVGNHGSSTNALYAEGTLTNTLTNDFTFRGKKVWADDGATNQSTRDARPECALELSRYPADGTHTYETASTVPVPTQTLKTSKTEDQENIIFPETSATPSAATLPRYDSDGNLYVYFVKETIGGATGQDVYEKIFTENGTEKGNDKFLFNGGTLKNRRTGSIGFDATKSWHALARQDIKAEVTMAPTREKQVRGTDGTYSYEPDSVFNDDTHNNKILSGFSAEQTTQIASFSFPKYDENGLAYRYGVKEAGIKMQVASTGLQPVEPAGEGFFKNADGASPSGYYRYKKEVTKDAATGNLVVANTLVGNAEIKINKTFPDGVLPGGADITYTVFRDGAPIGTKNVGYHPADPQYIYRDENNPGQPYTEQTTIKTYADFTPSPAATGELPRYAPDGHEYKYTITEGSVTGYGSPTYTSSNTDQKYGADAGAYANEHYLLAQTNVSNPIKGKGVSVLIKKQWIDDNDLQHHGTVVVGLRDKGTSQIVVDGDGKLCQGSIAADADRVYIAVPESYQKKTGDVAVPDYDRFDVVEVSVADAGGTENPVYAPNAVPSADSDKPSFAHDATKSWVRTLEHEYDVSVSDRVDADGAWVVINQRIGTVNIDLTKKWIDGSDQLKRRPTSVSFTVECAEQPVFTVDSQPSRTKIFTLNAPTSPSDEWKMAIPNLVKYDSQGKVLHYTIKENSLDPALSYASSKSHGSYLVGAHHTNDVDTYTFTNALSGLKTPVMNKIWKDKDRGTNIRPDFYPVIYESYMLSKGSKVTQKVVDYVDRDWKTGLKTKTEDWWQCSFAQLPAYTKDGYEIDYFIAEVINGSGAGAYNKDGTYYGRVPNAAGGFDETFIEGKGFESSFPQIQLTDGAGVSTGKSVSVLPAEIKSLPNPQPLVHEGGTVVNRLEANRTISGQKIWGNTPDRVAAEKTQWLPRITLGLYLSATPLADTPLQTAVLEPGATEFNFSQPVARYDKFGNALTYTIKETAPQDLSLCYDIKESQENGFKVTNTFKANQNYAITFTKTWTEVEKNGALIKPEQKPKVDLVLVRYMKKDATSVYQPETREVIRTQDAAKPADTRTLAFGDQTQTATWGNLAYYAPNGQPYQYKVEEYKSPVDALTIDEGKLKNPPINGYEVLTTPAAEVTGTYTPAAGTLPASGTGSAAMTNKYTGGPLVNLSVTKTWVGDAGYNISSRPAEVKVNLHRQVGDGTVYGDEVVNKTPLALNESGGWSAKVSNLERYAPNGEPYVYSFKEE